MNDTEVALEFSPTSVTMNNETEMRNFSFIRRADYPGSGSADYTTELPHGLSVGSKVKVTKVTSSNNVTGAGNSGFNGTFTVSGISSACQFTVTGFGDIDPGHFTNNTSSRTTSLPTFQRVNTKNNFFIYDIEEIREYVSGEQDGVYYFTVVDASSLSLIHI